MKETERIIGEAFGEVAALFMSNPLVGTKQIMPSTEISKILDRTMEKLRGKKTSAFSVGIYYKGEENDLLSGASEEDIVVIMRPTTENMALAKELLMNSFGNY